MVIPKLVASKTPVFFKMASTVRQIVRQHKQLIKFPNRIRIHKNPEPNNRPEISSTVAAIQRLPHLQPLNPITNVPTENTSPLSVDDAAIFDSLPLRYRRRIISQEEMEYIERGGPE